MSRPTPQTRTTRTSTAAAAAAAAGLGDSEPAGGDKRAGSHVSELDEGEDLDSTIDNLQHSWLEKYVSSTVGWRSMS